MTLTLNRRWPTRPVSQKDTTVLEPDVFVSAKRHMQKEEKECCFNCRPFDCLSTLWPVGVRFGPNLGLGMTSASVGQKLR